MTKPAASGISPISPTTATPRFNRAPERARTLVRQSVACALVLVPGGLAHAGQTVTLAWDPVTNHAVVGYALYQGDAGGIYTSRYDAGTNTNFTVTGLTDGFTNYFVTVDYDAALQESPRSGEVAYIVPGLIRLSPPAQPGAPMTIYFPVAVGHSYEIQASTNLLAWTNLWQTAVSTSNAWVSFQDPEAFAFSKRFYRLILN
jgi:hypothetical protein